MYIIVEILIAAGICAVVFILIWAAKGKMVTPVTSSDCAQLSMVVSARDDACHLEHVLQGIMWLCDSGNVKQLARCLEQKYERIKLCDIDNVSQVIGEQKWKQ